MIAPTSSPASGTLIVDGAQLHVASHAERAAATDDKAVAALVGAAVTTERSGSARGSVHTQLAMQPGDERAEG